jgi:single-strand DNA-binding protein
MGSMNRVTLIGRLGADPELKYTPASVAVCNFSLATSESWKDKSGTKQEKTEWHRVVAFRELAETCGKYLAKGREVCIEGKLQTRNYEKDGQKHYMTEVVADRVVFLGSAGDKREEAAPKPRDSGGPGATPKAPADDADSIPF